MTQANPPIKLSELLSDYSVADISNDASIASITLDSRSCVDGCVYFALKGLTTHGLSFIDDVLKANPVAVVVDANDGMLTSELAEKITKSCELVTVDQLVSKLGSISAKYYKTNDKGFQVVAVTGTDGKTSVSHFVAQTLNYREKCAGVLGTAGWGFPGELNASALTTPNIIEVHRQLFKLRESGARYVCMEVSSHALEQGRVDGVEFVAAVLTNLARDHLDFHGTVENYARAKRKLFLKPKLQAVILNADDKFGQKLIADKEVVARKISYGSAPDSNYKLRSLSSDQRGLIIDSVHDGESQQILTGLLGGFNAYNVLATWAALDVLGFPAVDVAQALSTLSPVVGRMEKFTAMNSPTVVVDFAHTPQALDLALTEVQKHCNGKVWCVFGCGGDRDKGKRSKMGFAASHKADYVVVTNDNPRTENPESIIEDILSGIEGSVSFEVVLDRESAIRYSLEKAASDDWVVVAGKGHEDYQIFGTEKIAFSDRAVVSQALREAV